MCCNLPSAKSLCPGKTAHIVFTLFSHSSAGALAGKEGYQQAFDEFFFMHLREIERVCEVMAVCLFHANIHGEVVKVLPQEADQRAGVMR
jgi:hypothetical protein